MPRDTPRPKRILWITTDHQRHDCVGANGNPAIRTPNLDRLAAGGVSFDDCWIQNPLSMPSRASFMTGLYPPQTGVTTNGQELPRRISSCADLFAAAGYQTAQIGKLHFQCHEDHDLTMQARHPYGFQYFMISEEPGSYQDAYGTWLTTEHPEYRDVMKVPRSSSGERHPWNMWAVSAPPEVSHAGFCAYQTIRYLHRPGPSFIHMGLYAPHPPLNPPQTFLDAYADLELPKPHWKEDEFADKPEPLKGWIQNQCRGRTTDDFLAFRRHFYAMCTLLDDQIGRVLAHLEEQGELDDTLILFMADHGDMAGDHRLISKGTHAFYPECMRIPVILHWPKGLPGGRRVAGLVEALDLLPTLCELGGAPVPPGLPGRSLAQDLRAGTARGRREDVLALHGPPGGTLCGMLRTQRHSYVTYGSGREVLYDLQEDPGEYVNRARDPARRDALNEMRERMLNHALTAAASVVPNHYKF